LVIAAAMEAGSAFAGAGSPRPAAKGDFQQYSRPDDKARAEETYRAAEKAKADERARLDRAKKAKAARDAVDRGAQEPAPPERLEPADWRELWHVRVGRVSGTHSQIAVRGPLVVVASAGDKVGPDPRDGIYVIDGRAGERTRIVRTIPTDDDAHGVGLQADVIVAAVGDKWRRIRLDGWALSADDPKIPGDVPGLFPKAPTATDIAVAADGFNVGATFWWIYVEGGVVEDRAGKRRSIPTPTPPTCPPSMGDVDGDGTWDVVVAAGDSVYAYSTGSRGILGRAFWAGDIEASGKQPRYGGTPAMHAAGLPARDVARWLVPDAEPSDTAFEKLPKALAGLPPPSKVTLNVNGVNAEGDDQTTCGGERFAISEGHLIRDERAGWRLVKGAPFPLARLVCNEEDGSLLMAGSARAYRLPPPLLWQPVAWGVAAALALALAGLAFFVRARIKRPGGTSSIDVRRLFLSDAPRSALDNAHPDQVRLVKGLQAFIDNDDTKPPMTVALYGKWGSGKSSIMKMLSGELRKTGRYIDVWFNAWRFQNEERLAPALLQSIVDEVGRQSDWLTRLSALLDRLYRARARDVLMVGAAAAVALFVFVLSVSFNKIQGWLPALAAFAAGLWHQVLMPLFKVFSFDPAKLLNTADSGKRIGFIKDFGDEFRRVLRRLPTHTRLIVYVDDLDRCSPDRIVPLLETLNMLADTGCSLFVIATDRDAVRRAVKLVHKETIELMAEDDPAEARRYGDRFLDKIVTVGVNVPQVKPTELHLEVPTPQPPPPLAAQLGQVLRKALRPRPGWAFFVALLVAVGGPLWAAVRADGDQRALVLNTIGGLLNLEQKPAEPAPAPNPPPLDSKGGSVPTPPARSPGPAPGPALTPAPAPKPGGPDLSKWIGTELPPPALPQATAPAITAESLRKLGEERRFAATLRNLIAGLGLLGLLVIAGVFWAQIEQRRRLAHAPPMASDSKEFADELKTWSSRLPNNPRTTIRFNNAARFLYHLVGASHPAEKGWEPAFFKIISRGWSPEPHLPAPQPSQPPAADPQWLGVELTTWIADDQKTIDANN
jgi:hypothetical protein